MRFGLRAPLLSRILYISVPCSRTLFLRNLDHLLHKEKTKGILRFLLMSLAKKVGLHYKLRMTFALQGKEVSQGHEDVERL